MIDNELANAIRNAAERLTAAMNKAGQEGLRVEIIFSQAESTSTPDNRGRVISWYLPTVRVSREVWL
jgi:hypothetical protein